MCPAVGVSLQELAIGAASRSTVARFLIDARRRDGVMTQCVGRLGLKQLPMPVDVPTSRLLALSYRLVDGNQTIQACRSPAQRFDRLSVNGWYGHFLNAHRYQGARAVITKAEALLTHVRCRFCAAALRLPPFHRWSATLFPKASTHAFSL